MRIDHVGYAVKNIDKAKPQFEVLGFSFGETVEDIDRGIYICFGDNDGYCIELVAPIKGAENPIDQVLVKSGATPYHFCYKSENLEEDIEELVKAKFMVTKEPAKAIAFGGNRVAFLYNAKVGLVELVEEA